MLYDSRTERSARIRHTPQLKQELTVFVSHGPTACSPWVELESEGGSPDKLVW
jgi:hypothetical protein